MITKWSLYLSSDHFLWSQFFCFFVVIYHVISHINILFWQYLAPEKSRLNLEISAFINIKQKFNKQFSAQAICSPGHFRYNPVEKTKVSKTRMDCSTTVRDPAHYSAHGLAENFILLNSRLNKLSVESINA